MLTRIEWWQVLKAELPIGYTASQQSFDLNLEF